MVAAGPTAPAPAQLMQQQPQRAAPPAFLRPLLTSTSARKLFTLAVVRDRAANRLLLGRKKRGFGASYINGFGGKVEAGESIEQAARRELAEEAGLVARELQHVGVLFFAFTDTPVPWEVHVFTVDAWSGEPRESDEMAPLWLPASPHTLPYAEMWADDIHWYPLLLADRCFVGLFAFREKELLWHTLQPLSTVADAPSDPLALLDGASEQQ